MMRQSLPFPQQVLILVGVIVLAITIPRSKASFAQLTLPDTLDTTECPSEYGTPRPVILVSLDGFRPDYLYRNRTPTLLQLSQLGVHSPYLLPVFPTKTFTNHYSIVTVSIVCVWGGRGNKYSHCTTRSEWMTVLQSDGGGGK